MGSILVNPLDEKISIKPKFTSLSPESDDVMDEVFINHYNNIKKLIMTMLITDSFGITTNKEDLLILKEPDDSVYNCYDKESVRKYSKDNINYKNTVISNLLDGKEKETNETIFQSIGKLPFTMGGKGWANHVITMALWYNNNVETYLSGESASNNRGIRKGYKCPLLGGKNVYDDCSSFVFACLQYYGIVYKGNYVPSTKDYLGHNYNDKFSKELEKIGFKNLPYDENNLKPFDIVALNNSNGHHVEIYAGTDSEGNRISYGWGNNNSKKKGKKMPHKYVNKKYTSIWRTNDVYNGIIGKLLFNVNDEYNFTSFKFSSNFTDYIGPADGSIGSKAFPQGKGKCISPNGQYWPFDTFGFGASPRKKPTEAKSMRSGVDCCKLAIETIIGYLDKGCKTIGDVICMYHAGISTYEKFLQYYNSIPGIKDIADGRFVSSQEMIQRQNYYQQNLVDYVHMSNKTPLTRSAKVLFPLITFISRQEQGVNSEEACRIALDEMGIT